MRSVSRRFQSLVIFLLLALNSCSIDQDFRRSMPKGEVNGYRPIYREEADTHITFEPARALKKPGKIYVYPPYLLVNEQNQGIHFFLNSDPNNPEPIGFLKIGGNTDFVMKENIVYANNYSDFVSLNVADRSNIRELTRIAQPSWVEDFPPVSEVVYFECVDPSRGELIGWEVGKIMNPKCYR